MHYLMYYYCALTKRLLPKSCLMNGCSECLSVSRSYHPSDLILSHLLHLSLYLNESYASSTPINVHPLAHW